MPSSASQVPNLTGGVSEMLPNHHITKPVLIGEIKDDGQFETVWQTDGSRARRCLVEVPRRLEGSDRRLEDAQVRQLQHRHEEVRRLTA